MHIDGEPTLEQKYRTAIAERDKLRGLYTDMLENLNRTWKEADERKKERPLTAR
jgi:hypothetical protein